MGLKFDITLHLTPCNDKQVRQPVNFFPTFSCLQVYGVGNDVFQFHQLQFGSIYLVNLDSLPNLIWISDTNETNDNDWWYTCIDQTKSSKLIPKMMVVGSWFLPSIYSNMTHITDLLISIFVFLFSLTWILLVTNGQLTCFLWILTKSFHSPNCFFVLSVDELIARSEQEIKECTPEVASMAEKDRTWFELGEMRMEDGMRRLRQETERTTQARTHTTRSISSCACLLPSKERWGWSGLLLLYSRFNCADWGRRSLVHTQILVRKKKQFGKNWRGRKNKRENWCKRLNDQNPEKREWIFASTLPTLPSNILLLPLLVAFVAPSPSLFFPLLPSFPLSFPLSCASPSSTPLQSVSIRWQQ